jgi:uncharacterized protein (TIGR03435 family)
MIQVAYRVKAEQIVGGPSWLDTELYDMEAKAEKPSNIDELHVMLMNMLVDRLHLTFHREKREMPVYALTVDKGGAKLKQNEAANAGEPWIDQATEKFLPLKMTATAVTMDYFAFRLAQSMDRPVVDLTNLTRRIRFQFGVHAGFAARVSRGKINGEDPDTSGPTVFAAVKQQLGMELKAQRGLADVIVIDHADKPSAD